MRNRNNINNSSRYIGMFIEWSERWERHLRMMIAALIGLLILSQVLLYFPHIRPVICSVDRLEGTKVE